MHSTLAEGYGLAAEAAAERKRLKRSNFPIVENPGIFQEIQDRLDQDEVIPDAPASTGMSDGTKALIYTGLAAVTWLGAKTIGSAIRSATEKMGK